MRSIPSPQHHRRLADVNLQKGKLKTEEVLRRHARSDSAVVKKGTHAARAGIMNAFRAA